MTKQADQEKKGRVPVQDGDPKLLHGHPKSTALYRANPPEELRAK